MPQYRRPPHHHPSSGTLLSKVSQFLHEFSRHPPPQRLGTESEISAAIVFLLSPASAFTSGSRHIIFPLDFADTLFVFCTQLSPLLSFNVLQDPVSLSTELHRMPSVTGRWLLAAAARAPSTASHWQVLPPHASPRCRAAHLEHTSRRSYGAAV